MDNSIHVSIIIPVYNNLEGLARCLLALSQQTYSPDLFEVLVIDNGSSIPVSMDTFKGVEIQNLHILQESTYLNSPYSARNRGLEKAQGTVLVFLDATCAPSARWIEYGLLALNKFDLVGGEVLFDLGSNPTLSAIYDSLFNVQMEDSVKKRGVAKAGNLFLKRAVWDRLGYFPEGLRSGGDVRWTGNAVKSGFSLGYSSDACVYIKPKDFNGLVGKQFRVAKGQPKIWEENGTIVVHVFKKMLLCWLPISPQSLIVKVKNSDLKLSRVKMVQLFFLGWFLRIVNGLGNLVGFVSK